MTTAFRDSLTTDTQMGLDYAASFTVDPAEAAADAVLRSPEMQKIKAYLKYTSKPTVSGNETAAQRARLVFHVGEAVADWVLS